MCVYICMYVYCQKTEQNFRFTRGVTLKNLLFWDVGECTGTAISVLAWKSPDGFQI